MKHEKNLLTCAFIVIIYSVFSQNHVIIISPFIKRPVNYRTAFLLDICSSVMQQMKASRSA